MKKKLYPMKFSPILKERVWGGDNLVKRYGKSLPVDEQGQPTGEINGNLVGESWEVSSISEEDDSVVAEGYLAENSLSDILETYMGDLVGDNIFDWYNLQFPLLVKLLDVKGRLSVQVHPDDATAFERFYEYGKDEFWYVMESSPEASVYMGFRRPTSAMEFYEKCKDGTVEELLNVYHPRKGDCFMIKAGTVHACGDGVVIAEIQEPSDLTFRLYDWGREFNPRTARPMHLDEAIDCIDFAAYDEASFHVDPKAGNGVVADCDHFTVRVLDLASEREVATDNLNSFIIYICTEGSATIRVDGAEEGEEYGLHRGESVLIPAGLDDFTIRPAEGGVRLLEATIRHIEEQEDSYLKK